MKAHIQHKDSLNQKLIIQALVPFAQLRESVLFTYRANVTQQEDNKYAQFVSSMEFYQRRVDSKRSDEIKAFIRNSILQERDGLQMATLFPTSMILALSVDEDDEWGNKLDIENDDSCDIDIQTNVFIVDGQHRMMGMIKLYDELSRFVVRTAEDDFVLDYLKKYRFNCTILVNYDLWEQGQVFVSVNFKQKPVNKSLYYEIFGSEYREDRSDWQRNKIYLAHEMARMLNENTESPFYQRIKMLGTGSGYVSQAFVVESLQRNFKKGGLWYFEPDNTLKKGYYGTELLSYFVAIKRLFPNYWPKEGERKGTIICKTTGFGAWIRLMGMLREDDNTQLLSYLKECAEDNSLCVPYINHVIKMLEPLKTHAETLFGDHSEFKSSSGQGSEAKLFRKMLYYLQNPYPILKDGESYGFDVESLREQVQEYIWTHPVDDLEPLGHRCEVEEIDEFKIEKYGERADGYDVKATFNVYVIIFLDNEDETGLSMHFPASCEVSLKHRDGSFEVEDNGVKISVDTDKYYQ